MCATAFISLWISDTAATALMVPIVEAVLLNLKDNNTDISAISYNNCNQIIILEIIFELIS
jgi:di/tricarboxylate transporter